MSVQGVWPWTVDSGTRLRRPPPRRPSPRPRSGRSRRRALLARAARPVVRARGRCRAGGLLCVRVQGGARDRRASATTRRALRRRSATTSSLHRLRSPTTAERRARPHRWASVGIISEPNAHPLNQEEVERRRRGPYVDRRAQRRRRQLRRPRGARTARVAGRDHDRRQGHPDARLAPPRGRRRRRPRRSARPSPRSRARWRSARRRATRPGQLCLRAARQRPGALRRAWPRTRSSSPASRTGSSRRRRTYLRHRRRDAAGTSDPAASRGQIVVLDAGARRRRSTASARFAYDGTRAAGDATTSCDRRRSRRATSTAATSRTSCSKEISEAPASFRKTLRGKIVERRRPARASTLGADDAARRRCGAPAATARSGASS